MASAAEYKLTYFNTQGLAEPIRYIFAIAGVQYEDVRLPKDDFWPKLRPEVKSQFPWGTVPVLKYKDLELSQSMAIARFLARKFDLVGDGEVEAAKCDEIVDALKDFTSEWSRYFYEPDAEKKQEMVLKLMSEWNPKYYKKFEEMLAAKKSDSNFIVGPRLTWADVCLAHTVFAYGNRKDCSHLAEYPHLQKYAEAFHELPAVKKWMRERPETI